MKWNPQFSTIDGSKLKCADFGDYLVLSFGKRQKLSFTRNKILGKCIVRIGPKSGVQSGFITDKWFPIMSESKVASQGTIIGNVRLRIKYVTTAETLRKHKRHLKKTRAKVGTQFAIKTPKKVAEMKKRSSVTLALKKVIRTKLTEDALNVDTSLQVSVIQGQGFPIEKGRAGF